MKDKDNITDFSELQKKMGEKNKKDEKSINSLEINKDSILEMLENSGGSLENSIFKEMLNNPDINSIIESFQSGKFSYQDVQEALEKFKVMEERFKKEKKTYRTFGQWIPYHKPYNLSTLCSIEQIQFIAKQVNVLYDKLDSKNSIIEKIKPYLKEYLSNLFLSLDQEVMSYIGKIIYSDGHFLVEILFTDEEEGILDFLQSRSILFRVNENGKHYLVIPIEFYNVIMQLDFKTIDKYNRLNSIINKTTMAFAISYGVYPKTVLLQSIKLQNHEFLESLEDLSIEKYVEKHLDYTFSKSYSFKSIYPSIIVTDDYINHGVIEFTKYLIDIQNELITEYKSLDPSQISERGKLLYYDDSIYLKQSIDIIQKDNSMDVDELNQIKNLIYIFSFLEFEPSLVLQMIEMRYHLPNDREYTKLVDILRNYYKNSEKWVLKGHTSFEVNNKNSNFDARKIVKLDFLNN